MQSVPYLAKPIVTTRDAIASHVRWKITLLMAARMREPLSERATQAIYHPEECATTQWLQSNYTLHMRDTAEYRTVLTRHLAFHHEMQRIAGIIQAADYAEVERLLTTHGSFEAASIALANAIMALDRIPASLVRAS